MPLDLETFKKMTKEDIKEYGESLPKGYTRDENGYELTHKDSSGYWDEYTRDEHGRELTFKNSRGYWREFTRDESGRELTFKNSSGRWYEFTYDGKGNILSYISSQGFWEEYTRDEHGNILTTKNSDGVDIKYFLWSKEFNLGYSENTKKYHAGCQKLSYEDCETFYKKNKNAYVDSHNFIEAIREHQKTLTGS